VGGDRAARGTTKDGVLIIPTVKPYDAGVYTCVQYLDGSRDGAFQVTVLVSQTGPGSARISACDFISIDTYNYADAVKKRLSTGEHREIECPVYSVTGMTYNWMKVEGDFSNRVIPNDQYLRFARLR